MGKSVSHNSIYMNVAPISERGQWFQDARFGLFIHFGLYTLVGRGEWVMYREGIDKDEYVQLKNQFNPHQFNAKDWVDLARRAGQKYIVISSRHHEGFCLFDSAYTDFKVTNTPFGRDMLAELAEECHRQDMPLFFYYSLMDWYHPAYQPSMKKNAPIADEFIDFLKAQLTELCTNYGKIAGIWFDGDWDHTAEQWRSEELVELVYSLQPHALVNNRLGGYPGDFATPEQLLNLKEKTDRMYEACVTINDNWGYTPTDQRHKSSRELIQTLARAAGDNTNLLLNVGPMPTGEVQEEHLKRLLEMGKWLSKNGESIYGTRAANITYLANTSTTIKDNKYYFHIFNWKQNTMVRIDLDIRQPVRRVYILEDSQEISYSQNVSYGEGLSANISLSTKNKGWSDIDAVVVVEVDEKLMADS